MKYDIYRYDGNERRQLLGGSEDLAGAFTLAGAWFNVAQQLYPEPGGGVGIDENGALVGRIAWIEDENE